MVEAYDYLFKIVLVGNSNVGKTSLMTRFTDKDFDDTGHKATVGVAFNTTKLPLESGKMSKLQIWDTAGQERFRAISSAYYRGAHAILIVFDMTNRQSFDDVGSWLSEIKTYHAGVGPADPLDDDDEFFNPKQHATTPSPLVYLFGNKSDLTNSRVITSAEGQELADQLQLVYKETSAKIGSGVYDAFLKIATGMETQYNTSLKVATDRERTILQRSSVVQLHSHEVSEEDTLNNQNKCKC